MKSEESECLVAANALLSASGACLQIMRMEKLGISSFSLSSSDIGFNKKEDGTTKFVSEGAVVVLSKTKISLVI